MITHYKLHDLTPSGLLAGDALTACGWHPRTQFGEGLLSAQLTRWMERRVTKDFQSVNCQNCLRELRR